MKADRLLPLCVGFLYEILLLPLHLVALLLSPFSRKIRLFYTHRSSISELADQLKDQPPGYLAFFCASIGEYEQALPFLHLLRGKGQPCFTFFYSVNGYAYAQGLGDAHIAMTPFDSFITWTYLFKLNRPSRVIMVRHEYWPGLIIAAFLQTKLVMIDVINKREFNPIQKFIVRLCYRVSEKTFFINSPPSANPKFIISGDTRLDRIRERKAAHLEEIVKLRQCFPNDKILVVVGNAYPEDYKMLLRLLDQQVEMMKGYLFVVVPARPAMLKKMEIAGRAVSITTEPSKDLYSGEQVLIIPVMGSLFQYYGIARLAWIGGGLSHGIHNSLEAASFEIPLVSGPNLNEQQDAIHLKKVGVLTTADTPESFGDFLAGPFKPYTMENLFPAGSPSNLILKNLDL